MEKQNWISFQGRTYKVAPGERALDAMLRQGAPVKFSCRKGTCLSCMLEVVSGDPGETAVERLPDELREAGFFLPCCATDVDSVEARLPDLSRCTRSAMVAEKSYPTPDILVLKLEPTSDFPWQAGQTIGLVNEKGDVRSYSLTGPKSDYFLEVHIRIYDDGAVSGWANSLSLGDLVQFQGPRGDFTYDTRHDGRPLVLIATGTGGGAVLGIAREALENGHNGQIHIYHGARTADELYLAEAMDALPSDQVTVTQLASRQSFRGQPAQRITDGILEDQPDLSEAVLYFCGRPDMVETARVKAVAHGAELDRMLSDPFEAPQPYMPADNEKFAAIKPDAEIWEALGRGDKLTEILHEFYDAVYEDPRLAPFFHRVTKQRAIEKQFNFLQDRFAGTKMYFGEKPFNAHHWMVISDELFDYRERLFFEIVRKHGVAEKLIHRWASIHEMFRREIVKSAPRGVMRKGEEVSLEGYNHETLDVSTVCDGCQKEINAGERVLMHIRTGEIFCARCEGEGQQNERAA